ncbi:MAG TPA: hypothetical protein VFW28_18500 [Micropepsaceae bacterium]|nr:hypothetical protein [Micropepsaceae bacterium]
MADLDPVARCAQLLRDRVAQFVSQNRRAAVLGFPENQNCGEHANWLGTLKLLSGLGLECVYTNSWTGYRRDANPAALGNATIFLTRALFAREDGVAAFLGSLPNRIVILPEAPPASDSIRPDVATAVAAHKGVLVFAGDEVTRKVIEQTIGGKQAVELAPPPAFALGVQQSDAEPPYDIVWLARTDSKDHSAEAASRLSSQSAEKLDLPRFSDGLDIDVVVKSRPPTVMLTDWSSLVFRSQEARLTCNGLDLTVRAQAYVERGLHVLSLGRVAITDRAGTHVLSLLLKQPHFMTGDATGANRSFFECWSRGAGAAHLSDTPAIAWSQARSLLHETRGE